ncbi:SPAC4G8.07c tRNA [Candida maltosa Xu316]
MSLRVPKAIANISTRNIHVSSSNFATYKKKQNISGLLKHLKKTKRRNDIANVTHPSKITFLEINDFLTHASGLKITHDEIKNNFDLIKAFLPNQREDEYVVDNVEVKGITSQGEGMAIIPKSAYWNNSTDNSREKYTVVLIPKTVIGDRVKVLVKMHHEYYAEGELLEVLNADSKESRRNNDLIVCKHFNECNGCQLQMLSYNDQLDFKKNVIHKAYNYFHPNIFNQIDSFGDVIGSPLQYSYRTKLTPHFTSYKGVTEKLGFQSAQHKGKINIDACPIATREINDKLVEAKEKYLGKPSTVSQLSLRQSLNVNQETGEFNEVALEGQNKVITERIGDFMFQFDSNCFFQNNNSILPSVLDYIKYHVAQIDKPIDNVIDTYCGVGFFGISLSKSFQENTKIFGIEISDSSIKYANHNVGLNHLDTNKIKFISGDASNMFSNKEFENSGITGKNSLVIVDPSRKGSDESFLKQLLDFEPEVVVYVSCNVFTQARDLAMLEKLQGNNVKYKVKDIRGFDFFPQTKHVKSVAILKKCI